MEMILKLQGLSDKNRVTAFQGIDDYFWRSQKMEFWAFYGKTTNQMGSE